MKLIVVNEGVWKSSVNDRVAHAENKRVTFKPMDPQEGDLPYYYLNITNYENDTAARQTVKDKWEPVCKKGNVLDVSVYESSKNVNKFGQLIVIKENK